MVCKVSFKDIKRLHEDFLLLFNEKNSDGTGDLRLRGKDLYQRIGTRLTQTHMVTLADFLKKYDNIVTLDLSYNDIGNAGLKILSENYFNSSNNMKSINLMHCNIKDQGMKAFSSSNFLTLRKCRINGNKLGTMGSRFVAQLIENCPTLVSLDIAETDQTQETINSILIVVEPSSLNVLDISRIIPSSYYSRYNASALADDLGILLTLNSNLTELHIQKCEFDGHDMEILVEGLSKNNSLIMLDLACNGIGDHGIEIISNWLKKRPNLRGLNVSANSIQNRGARTLSYGLPYSRIRLLDISYNKIQNDGMEHLLHTMKKSCMLRMFFFWGNIFGPPINVIIDRMLQSSALDQEYIDVKIYYVDNVPLAAHYPSNHYKHKYYSVMDYGCPENLTIKRNKIPTIDAKPRALLDLEHVSRYPPLQ